MSTEPKPPINQANIAALVEWAQDVPNQARRAIEANGPKMVAAMQEFAKAMGKKP